VPFVVPLQLRGEILGVVEYEVAEREFRYDKVLLAEELVNRLVVSLDNARLFQESQRAAERERTVNQISAKLTGQTDIQAIIQTAIREVGVALRTPQIAVRLQLGDVPQPHPELPDTTGNGHETA
jgi:GAF domain-containing protein